MSRMPVTLDVSKLSGWLNTNACCRVEKRAYDARRGMGRTREGMGRQQRTISMCTARGPGCEGWGGYRACAERTQNMPLMSVTLDVSKLSGWLNADALCRVERRAYDAGRGVGQGREGVGRRQRTSGMHDERARL